MKTSGRPFHLGKTLVPFTLAVIVGTLALLLFEGMHSLYRFSHHHQSAAYTLYIRAWNEFQSTAAHDQDLLADRKFIERLIPLMQKAGMGMGNVPYQELKLESAAVNHRVKGCYRAKPNVQKLTRQLRSPLFNPLDPIVVFWDPDAVLPQQLNAFVQQYGLREVRYNTDQYGHRTTIPIVSRSTKTLVAGDSVANGATLDDSETMSSRLQAAKPDQQYVNIAVNGATAADIVCAIENAISLFQRQVREIIYVYCENDFRAREPYGKPEEVIDWLRHFATRHSIESVIVVYAPYIYNVVPHVLARSARTHTSERRTLLDRAKQAGFAVIDIGEMAIEENQKRKTEFAALSLFVDHVHLSAYGTEELVKRILGKH